MRRVTSRQVYFTQRIALSLVSMGRDSGLLSTPLKLGLLIVLLAINVAPVQGGDVFQCPDGKGGIVLRDVPCSGLAPDQQPSAQTPSPGAPSPTREKAPPASKKRVVSPPVETSEPRLSNCLRVHSVKAHRQSSNALAIELAWEVAVQNQCKQAVNAMLTFTIYGSRDLVLDSESTKIVVSTDGVGTIHGIMRVSREKMRQMKRYDAKLLVL